MKSHYQTRNGFTLIELLVVISIIGILSSVILASLTAARDKGRIGSGQLFATNLYQSFGSEAAGVWNLDEGNGTTAQNSSGNSNTSGQINGATWTTGPNGKPALSFASGNYVNLGSVTTDLNVTVSAWIMTTSNAQQPVFSNRGNGLYLGTSNGKFFAYYNDGSPNGMSSIKTVNDGKWHHVAWTSNGTTEKMYIDGQLDSTMSQTRNSDTANGYIGYDPPNGEYFSGSISQFAIYTQSL